MVQQRSSDQRLSLRQSLAIGAVAAAALCLLGLHVAQPGLDPGWSVVSQYALGAQGWLLPAMFVLLAAACVLLATALPMERMRRAGRAGRILLVVAAVGLVVSAAFVVGTPLHDVGSLLGNAGLAIAAVVVGRDLRRGLGPAARRRSTLAAHAPWVLIVAMGAFIGAGVWGVGLFNRAAVLAYMAWIVVAAVQSTSRSVGAPARDTANARA